MGKEARGGYGGMSDVERGWRLREVRGRGRPVGSLRPL